MKKNPWIAAILNLTFSGLGYLYVGRKILFGSLILIANLIAYIWYFINLSKYQFVTDPLFNLPLLFLAIAFAIDAYQEAKINKL